MVWVYVIQYSILPLSSLYTSKLITEPLVKLILQQQDEVSYDCLADKISAKLVVKQQRGQRVEQAVDDVRQALSVSCRRALDLASEKGASN